MKVTKFEGENAKDAWFFARLGKITGSALKDIVAKRGVRKIGSYRLIAERLGVPPDGENPMERGSRLEVEAIERFKQETGKEVDNTKQIWCREDNEAIAVSPDGVISETEALEVKCLNSANHIEAYLNQSFPSEYEYQVYQYFVVNDKLETLYFVMYDPRFAMFKPGGELAKEKNNKSLDYFTIEIKREDVKEQVKECLEYQRKELEWVEEIVNKLTF